MKGRRFVKIIRLPNLPFNPIFFFISLKASCVFLRLKKSDFTLIMGRAQVNGKWFNLDIPAENTEYRRLYNINYYEKNKEKLKQYSVDYIKNRWRTDIEFRAKYATYKKTYHDKNIETIRENNKTRAYIRYTYDDEYRAAQQKKNRDRYQNDAEFREKQREYYKTKYLSCAEFREKQKKYAEMYRALGKMSTEYFVVKWD